MSDTNEAIALMQHDELVKKMARDLYFGNGQPALTVRMVLQEEAMATVKSDIAEIKDGQKQFMGMFVVTLLSSVGALIGIVIELLKH